MSYPLVSIIIPTYNRTEYLKLTLESVVNQTFQDFEIIVVDDGTPNDANQELCASIAKVQYVKIANSGGPAKPRNEGIKRAKGKYLAFVDDDDLWLPNKLEVQVTILENNPDFGLVHGCCEVIDEKGILQNRIIGRPGTSDVKHGAVLFKMMGNWTVMMPTSFIRKEIVDKVGFFNEEMPAAGEDTEFWTRCAFETKFYYVDSPLVQYRVHSSNISGNKRNYLLLPLYLKNVCEQYLKKGQINHRDYRFFIMALCRKQISMIKVSYSLTIKNLFLLDLFWILRSGLLKMMVYVVVFKK
ncbi:glycosyltransferase [Flavobacterium enshiense]|uniref:glycosyltransferase family 2 protein n=1 Tax=Flavobacterium enshiense TaxID=1341165 RepID=UPI00345D3CEB